MLNLISAQTARFFGMLILFTVFWILPAPPALAEMVTVPAGEFMSGKQRVVRGGSWDENKLNLRSSFRNVKPPVSGKSIYGSIGFRCASD